MFSLRHTTFIGSHSLVEGFNGWSKYLPIRDRCCGHIAEATQTDLKYTTRRIEMRGLQLRDARVVVGDGCRDRLFEA